MHYIYRQSVDDLASHESEDFTVYGDMGRDGEEEGHRSLRQLAPGMVWVCCLRCSGR